VLPAADFRPRRIFFPNLGVNRRVCLCDVESYVSAQTLAFLDIGKKSRFVAWKSVPDQQRSFRPWPAGRSGFFRLRRTGVRLTGKPLCGLDQKQKSALLEGNDFPIWETIFSS
jgi:hypothetical protein